MFNKIVKSFTGVLLNCLKNLQNRADFLNVILTPESIKESREKSKEWIQAFLTKRTQLVVVKGEHSDPTLAQSGVPQGQRSVLGPSLFLLYINDLPKSLY